MLPDPLHPAVVHFPIALAVLIPILAGLAILLIRRQVFQPRVWTVVVFLQALLVVSSWAALETGEDQEDRVERIVAERHIEEHEEAAERFLILAGIGLLAGAAGLLPDKAGALGRTAGALVALAVLAAGVSVGHSGGELVYTHGAANAYIDRSAGEQPALPSRIASPD